ncbi:hypothetical protein DMENIID0001_140420 [Sergentomyia squamirostris]
MWKEKNCPQKDLEALEISKLLQEAKYLPGIKNALKISLAQPCSTNTIERSFSTLRRVKIWLRSTMTEDRVSGRCLVNIHKDIVDSRSDEFIEEVLKRFSLNPRRLMLN